MNTAGRLSFLLLSCIWTTLFAQLRVVAPNGGEVLPPGTTYTIRWAGVVPTTKVTLEYSTDSGTQWNLIVSDVSGLAYDWNVPATLSTTCLLRVVIRNQIISEDSILTDNIAYADLPAPSEMLWGPTSKTLGFGGANRVFRVSDLALLFDDSTSNDCCIALSSDGQTIVLRRPWGADMFDVQSGSFKRRFDFNLAFDVIWKHSDLSHFFGIGSRTILFDTAFSTGIDTLNTVRWSYTMWHDFSIPVNRYLVSFASGITEAIGFDLTTMDSLYVLDAGEDCNGLRINNDGTMVATFGKTGIVKIWNTQTGALISSFQTPRIVSHVHSWSNNNHLAIGTTDDSIMVWNAVAGTLVYTLHCIGGVPMNMAYRPGDSKYLMAEGGGRLFIFDGATGALLQNWNHFATLPIGGAQFSGDGNVQWSPDGTMIAMRDAYGKFAIFYVVEQAGAQDQSDTTWTISAIVPQSYAIRIGIDSAYAGELVDLPIILSDPQTVYAQGARILRVKYLYNSTLLENLPGDPGTTLIRAVGIGDIGLTLTNAPDSIIGRLHFRAGLGNAPNTALQIDSASTDSPNALLVPTDGLFSLRGICYEGGPRLMNPSGTPSINVPTRITTGSHLPVAITLIEEGRTKLYLADMLGRTTKIYLNEVVLPGNRHLTLDLTAIPTGTYLLVLETPTTQLTRSIEVTR